MRLLRLPEPFDHPDFLYEVKFDGFRALAHVTGHHCRLVSRNGHTFKMMKAIETHTTEVSSVSTAPIPDSMFEISADYKVIKR